jgi:hypothetical protein
MDNQFYCIGGLVVKLAVAMRRILTSKIFFDIGQPRVRFPADAFLLVSLLL